MRTLISWTHKQLTNQALHPLIITATFVYEFLSIHPYQDGNGRLSRLLTTLLLLRNNYDFMQYASMEIEIEKRKKEYYKVLMNGQKNRGTKKEIINEWIIFFLEVLEQAIYKLENRYSEIKNLKTYLNKRQKEVIRFIEENEPVKINDIDQALKEYTSYTLKKDVKFLVDEGILKKMGKARATIYILNKEKKTRFNET